MDQRIQEEVGPNVQQAARHQNNKGETHDPLRGGSVWRRPGYSGGSVLREVSGAEVVATCERQILGATAIR